MQRRDSQGIDSAEGNLLVAVYAVHGGIDGRGEDCDCYFGSRVVTFFFQMGACQEKTAAVTRRRISRLPSRRRQCRWLYVPGEDGDSDKTESGRAGLNE